MCLTFKTITGFTAHKRHGNNNIIHKQIPVTPLLFRPLKLKTITILLIMLNIGTDAQTNPKI